MPKPLRLYPDIRRQHPERRYYGEEHGSEAANYLNGFPGIRRKSDFGPGQKRILFLLEMLRPVVFGKRIYAPGDSRLKCTRRANRVLHRYKTFLLVAPNAADLSGAGRTTNPFSLAFTNVIHGANFAASQECIAAYALMRLAELNSLNSLKTCKQCGLWFFAKFAHQEFCRKECRIKHNSSSDEWKEYKRNKAREYYQLHKSGKVREH